MFLEQAWYVAAWSREISAEPFPRTILNQPLVIFRGEAGQAICLEDRCSHRHVPLHLGRVCGNTIRCGYHGLLFDQEGRCVEVPGQSRIPPRAAIRSYPVHERHGLLWVWTGDPSRAREDAIPDCSWASDPARNATGDITHVQCNYRLILENLMDSSHIEYVHPSTVGGEATNREARMDVVRLSHGVRLERWLVDVPAPPTYLATGQVDGNVDRWQRSEYTAPALIRQRVGGANTGTGAPEGRRVGGVELLLTHFATPETERSTLYFWAIARDFSLGDAAVTQKLFEDVALAFSEDKRVLEAQQRANERFPQLAPVNINADAAAFQSRRLLDRLLLEERQANLAGNPDVASIAQ